jgi:hypothetical protein
MAGDQRSTTQCCVGYLGTLATWTLIILFSENVEIFKNYFFQIKNYCEGRYLRIFHLLK